MPKFDHQRLAKTAAGDPAEFMVSVVRGTLAAPIHVAGGSFEPQARDGLISALQWGGTVITDITATAKFTGHGTIDPGTDISDDQLVIYWYRFEG